jgi:hypothetical protein
VKGGFLMGATAATITADQLQPLLDAITNNVGVILPVGVSVMAVLAGVSLIPKIFYRFF